MTTRLLMNKDINGYATGARPFSDTVFSADLVSETESTLEVPANAKVAYFSYEKDMNVYVNPVTTAAPPETGTFEANLSVLNPEAFEVVGGSTLSFLALTGGVVVVSFYND